MVFMVMMESDVAIAKSQANYLTYGVLYNWYAVDQASICPTGWHVPTDAEWTELSDFWWRCCGWKIVKSFFTWDGTNSSGFTALPAGYRVVIGGFYNLEGYAFFWSSCEDDPGDSWRRRLILAILESIVL